MIREMIAIADVWYDTYSDIRNSGKGHRETCQLMDSLKAAVEPGRYLPHPTDEIEWAARYNNITR